MRISSLLVRVELFVVLLFLPAVSAIIYLFALRFVRINRAARSRWIDPCVLVFLFVRSAAFIINLFAIRFVRIFSLLLVRVELCVLLLFLPVRSAIINLFVLFTAVNIEVLCWNLLYYLCERETGLVGPSEWRRFFGEDLEGDFVGGLGGILYLWLGNAGAWILIGCSLYSWVEWILLIYS